MNTVTVNYQIIYSSGLLLPASSVSVRSTDSVAAVKKAIMNASGYPRSPRNLILYRISSPTTINEGGWAFVSSQHQRLGDTDTIASVFPAPCAGNIHIVVEAPKGARHFVLVVNIHLRRD